MVVEISTNPAHTTFATVSTINLISTTCASESIDLSSYSGDRVIRLRDTRTSGSHERTISDINLACPAGKTVTFSSNYGTPTTTTQTS